MSLLNALIFIQDKKLLIKIEYGGKEEKNVILWTFKKKGTTEIILLLHSESTGIDSRQH